MIAEKVSKYITEQMDKGVTQQELHDKLVIVGDAVVRIKKSGKKFNLEIQLGCVSL